jgi:sulfur relay (sulfurtransferase) DsrC/TusE family protein
MESVLLAGKTLALDADGNLANRNDWNQEIAGEIAAIEGILRVRNGTCPGWPLS